MKDPKTAITESLEDGFLSKSEKQEIQDILAKKGLSVEEQLDLIRQSIDIASERADANNYEYVFKWLKKITALLSATNADKDVPHSNAFFAKKDNLRGQVIKALEEAERSLDICVFTISDDPITNAIIHKKKEGVRVRIITDDEKMMDLGSDIFRLKNKGIEVKIDGSKTLMHHKFAIIDGQKVINGSFNWTRSATESNYENIVITDNNDLLKAFKSEFDKLWGSLEKL